MATAFVFPVAFRLAKAAARSAGAACALSKEREHDSYVCFLQQGALRWALLQRVPYSKEKLNTFFDISDSSRHFCVCILSVHETRFWDNYTFCCKYFFLISHCIACFVYTFMPVKCFWDRVLFAIKFLPYSWVFNHFPLLETKILKVFNPQRVKPNLSV